MGLNCEESSWIAGPSGTARPTAHSLPFDERITNILEPLPIAELSCAESAEFLTSTRRSLGLDFTPQAPDPDYQLFGFLPTFPSGLLWILSGAGYKRLRHLYECDADRAQKNPISPFAQDSSLWSRPYRDRA